jgi:D-glycero-D-manno-heptose 1,7-bisphosphate phosphatase
MNKALFLDRDGVLNRERSRYTYSLDDFEVLADVSESLQLALQKGYLLIVISNQGGVAKQVFTAERVEELHAILTSTLAKDGVHFNEVYYCRHHDEVGKCICRKPDSLMLEKAMARFNIDPKLSLMIGDSPRDVEAATKAGIKGHLIDSNTGILEIVKQLK